jgi:hypothetical protein
MFNLDQAIAEWRRQMNSAGLKSREILDELESHLREDVEQQMRSGIAAKTAFDEAVLRVGAAEKLNQEFGKITLPQPRLSRRAARGYCIAAALFVFAIETWTLLIYDVTPIGRFLGEVFVLLAAGYIGALPDLNRKTLFGVRGWALRNAITAVCNGVVIVWMCLLWLSLAHINVLPDWILLNVVCWNLFAAAAFTVVILAYGTGPDMLDLWSPTAWRSFEFAEMEASRFRHDFIGTEHVLLGLMGEENGSVSNVLRKMGVRRETIRAEIEKIMGIGPQLHTDRKPVCTPRAKKALRLAIREAKSAGRNRVEPEHIFLGLLREGGGVAAKVLMGLGLNASAVREEIQKEQGGR